mgnify:CR=1 FL=1
MGPSSERTQGGENRNFNSPKHDDRDGAALEAPAHRDRDAAISLREANSSRAVRLPVTLHPPSAHPCAPALWQVSCLVLPQPRHAGADSTVKMTTIGQELRHPAAEGPPPPGRRLHLGGAGRRRRRRLHLRAGCYALLRACGSLEQRAPRPPAATCFGTCLAGHLKEVLGCSWHVFDRVSVSVCGLFCDVACAPR